MSSADFHALDDGAGSGFASPALSSPATPYARPGQFAGPNLSLAGSSEGGGDSRGPASPAQFRFGAVAAAASHASFKSPSHDEHGADAGAGGGGGGGAADDEDDTIGVCPPTRSNATLIVALSVMVSVASVVLAVHNRMPPPSPSPSAGPSGAAWSVAYLTGKFFPENTTDFVQVPAEYADGLTNRYVRAETWSAWQALNGAAQREINRNLTILSATRNFWYQKGIWETKWNGAYSNITGDAARAQAIMAYSSMPSTSQHHWGSAMDLVSLEPTYFTDTAAGRALDTWLGVRLSAFGFCRPYSPKPPRTAGYDEEQWHVAYKPLLQSQLAAYRATVTYADINGFAGSDAAPALRAIEDYVIGIDPAYSTAPMYAPFDPTKKKTSSGATSRLYQPKTVYYSEPFIEPDRRHAIERAIAAKVRLNPKPFNHYATGNRHNARGTFSEFEYLHAGDASLRPPTAPAPHTNSLRAHVAAADELSATRNSLAPLPSPKSGKGAANGGGSGSASARSGVPSLALAGVLEVEEARAKRLGLPDRDGCPRVHQGVTTIRRRAMSTGGNATASGGALSSRHAYGTGSMHTQAAWHAAPFTDRPLTHVHRAPTTKGKAPFRMASGQTTMRAPVGFSGSGSASVGGGQLPLERGVSDVTASGAAPRPLGGDSAGRSVSGSALQGLFDKTARNMAPANTQTPLWASMTAHAIVPLRALHAQPFKGGHPPATLAPTDFISGHSAPAHLPENYDASQRAWAARSLDGFMGENGFRPAPQKGHVWRQTRHSGTARAAASAAATTAGSAQMASVKQREVVHHPLMAAQSSGVVAALNAQIRAAGTKF